MSTRYDPQRNQIVRNIDVLLETCGSRAPMFWMIAKDREASRAYVQLMRAYRESAEALEALLPHRSREEIDRVRPTLAIVHGNAFGGGIGLVACCDIALASAGAQFSLSEVKLGLIPATISPFVIDAIGPRQARRLFLSAERFDANAAMRFGLIHEVSPADRLEECAESFVIQLLGNGPRAMTASKELVSAVAHRPIDENVLADVAARIASQRASEEGREGVAAFLAKRSPAWMRD